MSTLPNHVARAVWVAVTSGFVLVDHKRGDVLIKLDRDRDGWLWMLRFGEVRFGTFALHTKSLKDAKPIAVEMFCGWLANASALAMESAHE